MHGVILSCSFLLVTQLQNDVLCERTSFRVNSPNRPPAGFAAGERIDGPKKAGTYVLSSITVPLGGWRLSRIAIYTSSATPARWLKVNRGRFHLLAKKADLPAEEDDPRVSREVDVAVRETQKGICEVRAALADVFLQPGEYWIGLTPIYDFTQHGQPFHLIATNVHDARFDDVVRCPDGGTGLAFLKNWKAYGPAIYAPLGDHLAIKVEGKRLPRGKLLDRPRDNQAAEKKPLHLRYATFDPLVEVPKIPEELTARAEGKLWIVQWQHIVDAGTRTALTKARARLLCYLPDDAYLVEMAPDLVEKLRQQPGVRWVGPYHPAYRIDPLVAPEPFNRPSFGDRVPHQEPKGIRYVIVYLFDRDAATKAAVAAAIRAVGGQVFSQEAEGCYLAAELPLKALPFVARHDAVCAIERRFEGLELHQDPARTSSQRITLAQIRELCGAEAVKAAASYEGLGVRIAFWDDGIRQDHIDLLGRPLTTLGPQPPVNANHGTAIASILCGEGRGDPRARGLLPLGGIVFANEGNHTNSYHLMKQFVHEQHAVVFSSSSTHWGMGPGIEHYDGYASLLDEVVSANDLLICAAIGNASAGRGGAGSWSKNTIMVGGVHPHASVRREDHRPLPCTTGPAQDGRVKPDLVHFGFGVFCADAASRRGYANFGGTSCATPLTAGLCGLMFEMWADNAFSTWPLGQTVFERRPHAATAKALMINSAYQYPVTDTKPTFTRFQQGWGRPDVRRLYESRNKLFIVNEETALHDHQAIEYQLPVAEHAPELRATLAWTDPPGTTTAVNALVNDLDLIAIAPDGTRYHGNHGLLEGNYSQPGGGPDRLNNVENIFVQHPQAGAWRVIVAAHRIADSRRRDSTEWGQDFGLVVSGVAGRQLGK